MHQLSTLAMRPHVSFSWLRGSLFLEPTGRARPRSWSRLPLRSTPRKILLLLLLRRAPMGPVSPRARARRLSAAQMQLFHEGLCSTEFVPSKGADPRRTPYPVVNRIPRTTAMGHRLLLLHLRCPHQRGPYSRRTLPIVAESRVASVPLLMRPVVETPRSS